MTLLDRTFNIKWEVVETIDLKRLANITKQKQDLHLDCLIVRANGSHDIVHEPDVSVPYLSDLLVTICSPAIKAFYIKFLL